MQWPRQQKTEIGIIRTTKIGVSASVDGLMVTDTNAF